MLQNCSAERIKSLPSHLLPRPNCSKADKGNKPNPRTFARVTFQDATPDTAGLYVDHTEQPRKIFKPATGLAKTVQDMMRSYVPASIEKKAFYCRACQYQATSEEDLFAHRETESHLNLSEIERRASFCKLCRKQFTSPQQIKEHLKGKAHKAKMDAMSRNQNRSRSKDGITYDRI